MLHEYPTPGGCVATGRDRASQVVAREGVTLTRRPPVDPLLATLLVNLDRLELSTPNTPSPKRYVSLPVSSPYSPNPHAYPSPIPVKPVLESPQITPERVLARRMSPGSPHPATFHARFSSSRLGSSSEHATLRLQTSISLPPGAFPCPARSSGTSFPASAT